MRCGAAERVAPEKLVTKRDSVTSFSAREAGRFQTDFGLIFCGRGVPPEPENYQVARLDVFSRLRQRVLPSINNFLNYILLPERSM